MNRKDGYQSKPVGDQGRELKRPSSSLNNTKKWQGEDFPGHRSQAQISPSENFRALIKQGTFWNETDPKETQQTRAE